MNASPLISEEQLKQWCGFEQRARLITWLNENGVQYMLGRGNRICVHSHWLSQRNGTSATDEIEFEE